MFAYRQLLKTKIILLRLFGRNVTRQKIKLFKARGYRIGKDCKIFTNLAGAEPFLVAIGDNVTISTNVTLLTHDNAIIKASGEQYTDLFGRIIVDDGCFIGANSIIMPGVSLAKGTIVAAGSVVTKSVKTPNLIIGGNPAKIVGTTEDYLKKNKQFGMNLAGLSRKKRKQYILDNENKLIKKKEIQ